MIYQWSIFQADLEPTLGNEQTGERPVLVVVPITSRKNERPTRLGEVLLPAGAGGLPRASFALCCQTRALDKARLARHYGELKDLALRQAVLDTLALCFDIA